MHCRIVVSGLPASGKTTLARRLAQALGWFFLDKDEFLEALFGVEAGIDPAARRRLSRSADAAFRAAAEAAPTAVLASWWGHPASTIDTGTPTDWLRMLPGTIAEVHCACRPDIATQRFLDRRRHPGHHDERWTRADLLAALVDQQRHGPLFTDRAEVVCTESEIAPAMLAQIADRAVARARAVPSLPPSA